MDLQRLPQHLEDTFTEGGIFAPYVAIVRSDEQAYHAYVTDSFAGYARLTDSFLSLYIETLTIAETQRLARGATACGPGYAPLVVQHCANVHTLRAADRVLRCGAPMIAYGLLRDLKDRALCLAAIAHGWTTVEQLLGLDTVTEGVQAWTADELEKTRKRRKDTQPQLVARMIGKTSGLPPAVQKKLKSWREMFHEEVHGALLTSGAHCGPWLEGTAPLSLLPPMDQPDYSVAMYFNRSQEIAWMLLRTLPFLQLEAHAFGQQWATKWGVLDDAFRTVVDDMARAGKAMAVAITHLVDTKFTFWPGTTHYFEH